MPSRVPGIDGQPVQANSVQAPQGPAQDQSLAIVGAQLQGAGGAVRREGLQSMRAGQALLDSANDARSTQQATLHGKELSTLVADYRNTLAADAHNGYEALNKSVTELRDRHAGQLKNSQQAVLYGKKVDAQLRQARGVIDRHYAQQTRAWDLEQTEVSINSNARDYQEAALLDDAHDDERTARMSIARDVMEKQFDKLSRMSGLTGKVAKEHKKERLAKLHAGTLDVLADTNADQAEDYLEQFGDEMDVKTRTRAQKIVDAATLQDRALTRTRELMNSAGDDATPTERLQAVMAGAESITDADEYRAVVAFAGAEFSRQQRVDAGSKNDLMSDVERRIYAEGGEFLTFQDLPATLQHDLRQNGLVDETMALVGQRDRVSQEMVVQNAIRNPDQFRGVDPQTFERSHRPRLSKSDYALVEGIYNRANGFVDRGTPVANVLDHKDGFDALMVENGYTKEAMENDPALQVEAGNLRRAFQELIDRGALTKEMSHTQERAVLSGIFQARATVPGGVFTPDRDVPLRAFAEGAAITVATRDGNVRSSRVGAIPPLVATEIRNSLATPSNPNPTERQKQQAWFELDQPKNVQELKQRAADPAYVAKGIVSQVRDMGRSVDDIVGEIDGGVRAQVDQLYASFRTSHLASTFGSRPHVILGFLPKTYTAKQKDDARRYMDLIVRKQQQ